MGTYKLKSSQDCLDLIERNVKATLTVLLQVMLSSKEARDSVIKILKSFTYSSSLECNIKVYLGEYLILSERLKFLKQETT